MARVLIIAYTTYAHDGRVKRQAEALSRPGRPSRRDLPLFGTTH